MAVKYTPKITLSLLKLKMKFENSKLKCQKRSRWLDQFFGRGEKWYHANHQGVYALRKGVHGETCDHFASWMNAILDRVLIEQESDDLSHLWKISICFAHIMKNFAGNKVKRLTAY